MPSLVVLAGNVRCDHPALLVCLLHQAQVQTRDQLAEMLLKRMRRTRTLAREKLKELQEQHRELEEHMLAQGDRILSCSSDHRE